MEDTSSMAFAQEAEHSDRESKPVLLNPVR